MSYKIKINPEHPSVELERKTSLCLFLVVGCPIGQEEGRRAGYRQPNSLLGDALQVTFECFTALIYCSP